MAKNFAGSEMANYKARVEATRAERSMRATGNAILSVTLWLMSAIIPALAYAFVYTQTEIDLGITALVCGGILLVTRFVVSFIVK